MVLWEHYERCPSIRSLAYVRRRSLEIGFWVEGLELSVKPVIGMAETVLWSSACTLGYSCTSPTLNFGVKASYDVDMSSFPFCCSGLRGETVLVLEL